MLDKNLIQSTSSWPFVEIRKLLKDRKDIIKKKGKITKQEQQKDNKQNMKRKKTE